MLKYLLCEEILSGIQIEPSLKQHQYVSSHPVTYHLGKDTDTLLTATSL